ncbi:MAG: biopolymer transporter ExbD [Sedimentisphaerales bacterium]|nr:biopolymer transporter ExbD [Sedimentisphaerales bacterium]
MKKKSHSILRDSQPPQFNMTPMIDVVFLLIIFFMLICQFIVQENYKLEIPDDCAHAIVPDHPDEGAITVSVYPKPVQDDETAQNEVLFAVRSYRFDPADPRYRHDGDLLIADMSRQITEQAQRKSDPLINLRADKDMTYGNVQKALLALARSKITRVQLAAYRSEQMDK